MPDSVAHDVDAIKELRLRRWARKNYVPADERRNTWHPIVIDEMLRKDRELSEPLSSPPSRASYVPLAPGGVYYVHGKHARPQPARQVSDESIPSVR